MPEDLDLTPELETQEVDISDAPIELGDKGKAALSKERKERQALERKLKQLQEQYNGIDPDKYSKLVEEETRRELTEAERQKHFEKASQIKDKEIQSLSQLKSELEKTNESLRKQNALQKVYFRNKGKDMTDPLIGASYFDKFYRDFSDRFELQEDGSILVLNDQGIELFNETTGKNMTVDEYMATIKEHSLYGQMFEAEPMRSGTGQTVGKNGKGQTSFEEHFKIRK